ncbi:hypothetical protein NEIMUCOT_03786 [Neisseria mucosa ATCC 25996]|uniref:Uncharacterized protein n=1 Tax=Neisseria mucosa (strain ATCC 25996 / DSM 4631 / NCTC 10774 / M26) TaxID=546266 RepID=D2ZT52_NEIM2|nr:hypothetical protein NEIMUCOT_03786 [Neisseria mucosa ATCC 25996]
MASVRQGGLGYLFEATLNLFDVSSGRADGMPRSSFESAIFSDDLCSANECGGILWLLYNCCFDF